MISFEDLLKILDIDNLTEFEYFEQLADLLEVSDEIDFEVFFKILSQISLSDLGGLIDNYFEDILTGVPDDAMAFHTLLGNIQNLLISLASGKDSYEKRRSMVEELYRFRNWYTLEPFVKCIEQGSDDPVRCSICEAFALFRLQKLGESSYSFDFSDCDDYS